MRKLVALASTVGLLMSVSIATTAVSVSASSCPQTASAAAHYLTAFGATGSQRVQSSDMSAMPRDPSNHLIVGWKFDSGTTPRWIGWPHIGALDWGGREDGSGVQHGWSTKKHYRTAPMTGFAWWCFAQRGPGTGRLLSQWPRNDQMASNLLTHGVAPASDFGLDPTSNLGHWMFDGRGKSYTLYAAFGRWDIADDSGNPANICPGSQGDRPGGSWWALGLC